jgi:hypothetical protein
MILGDFEYRQKNFTIVKKTKNTKTPFVEQDFLENYPKSEVFRSLRSRHPIGKEEKSRKFSNRQEKFAVFDFRQKKFTIFDFRQNFFTNFDFRQNGRFKKNRASFASLVFAYRL